MFETSINLLDFEGKDPAFDSLLNEYRTAWARMRQADNDKAVSMAEYDIFALRSKQAFWNCVERVAAIKSKSCGDDADAAFKNL